MGKKTQPKGRNPRKPIRRLADGSPQSVSNAEAGDDASQGAATAAACNHYAKGGDELRRVLLKIMSSSDSVGSCEHCREAPVSKRGNKEKGKQQKKGGAKSSAAKPESNPIWVCLDCSHYACGGAVKDTEPYGHARRHAKQESHHWAVRLDDPSICWCFPCNSLVPIELPELANGDAESAKNVVDGFLGGSTGQGKGGVDVRGHQSPESLKGHTIRGLVNLGNTCFFNSVMQNLFAMDTLRNYFAATERPLGPLAMALKKLFMETSGTADSRGSLSPKALFGSICAKAPQFRGFQQQDSHELLRYLLDGLHTEETSSRKGSSDEKDKSSSNQGSTFVEFIFGGQLSSTVSCMDCGHKSVVHEPFLDLSLPLPSKKSPAKKVPPPPPKRSKPPAKEKGRGRRFREKGNAKVAIAKEHHTVENANTHSDCSEHCLPASEPKPVVAAEVEEDSFSWMDYLDPCAMPNSDDLVSQTCEIQNHGVEVGDESSFVDCGGTGIPTDTADSVPQNRESEHAASKVNDDYVRSDCAKPSLMQDDAASVSKNTGTPVSHCSVGEQISQNEPDVHHTLNSNTEGSAEEPIVSDSCREVSCRDDIPSCTQDSSVTLLPHNEVDSTTEVINGATSCSQLIGSSVQTAAGCEQQTEADFDGFGDLFNEPEAMSESREGAAMADETDTAMWAGNFSESNQDEVDNMNAPVSIDSCLALFTKPELLLSDEHGWECERCSEILSHHNTGHKRDEIRRKKNDAGRNGIRIKSASSNSDVDHADSAAPGILSNTKTEAMSAKLGAHDEKHEFLNEKMDTSHESLDLVGGSYGMRHESADDCFEGNKLLDHAGSNGTQCTDLMHKDDNSQYMDHAPVCEKGRLLSSSGNQKNSAYSTNDSTSVQCIGQALALASISSSENSEVEKGNFSEFSQIEKRSSKLVDVNPSNDDKAVKKNPKGKMVKRDASKRILVNKVPPILTIHLKRFAQDARGRLNKLRGHVCFQETLDLTPYMDPRCENKEKCCYRLVGLVEHSGSMSGGHYVAYVRGDKSRGGGQKSDNSAWFYASDSHVRETSLSEVLQSEAYILFYERV